jgi:hypothetical protein
MKKQGIIKIVVLIVTVSATGYWLGYEHGSNTVSSALKPVGSLEKVGLEFRAKQNDLPPNFRITGDVVDTKG